MTPSPGETLLRFVLDETRARVVVRLAGSVRREASADLRADHDPEAIGRDHRGKFRGLVSPRLGAEATARLLTLIGRLDEVEDIRDLTRRGEVP